MVANRGYESLDAKSRLRLIDAAADLLASEGHPAFSARRVAERAQLKPQLVHYYFRSMEELVVAVFHRATAEYFRRHDEAISTPRALHALWQLNRHLPVARLMLEFVALGKRYPMLREEMRQAGASFRQLQIEAIESRYSKLPSTDGLPSVEALAMLLSAVARSYVIEDNVNMTVGHDAIDVFIRDLLGRIEPPA